MAYKRRKSETRCCVHCGDTYESNHKRRIYCSSSCNTLAYLARRAEQDPARLTRELIVQESLPLTPAEVVPAQPAAEPLTFHQTMASVAVATAGVSLAGRLLTADERQKQADTLQHISRQTSLTGAELGDFIGAYLEGDPALAQRFLKRRRIRQQQTAAARINSRKPFGR